MKMTPLFLTLAAGAFLVNSSPAQNNTNAYGDNGMSSTNDAPNMANPLRTPRDSQNTNMYGGATDMTNNARAYRRRGNTNMTDANVSSTYATNHNYSNGATNVDNTGINRRDEDNASPTVMDQGNSRADIGISANIRKQVVASTNNFSTDAKNVKIITQNGKVTLRGPVASDAEKAQIESIAKEVAGNQNVEDDLEVKSNQ
jgi:osmotically-inducible protein OsmY